MVDPAPRLKPDGGEAGVDPLRDGGPLVAHLVLSVTNGMEVSWRPVDPGGPAVLSLLSSGPAPAPEGQQETVSPSVAAARRMLQSLPRRWRKASTKRLAALQLDPLDGETAALLVSALRARAAGDPAEAAALLEEASSDEGPPVISYLLGACRFEAGDLPGAAAAMGSLGERAKELPRPLASMARAIREAEAGDRASALSLVDSVIKALPSLPEARQLRVQLSRTWCDMYDQQQIIDDLDEAFRAQPCCVGCTLQMAEILSFSGRPATAPVRIRAEAACAGGPLDSARDRALALAYGASGAADDALRAAARAETRDVSALRHGLAPAFILTGDTKHLDEVYNTEADLQLSPSVSVEHHLYAGLNALWRGRPSASAAQFERAEEHLLAGATEDSDLLSWLQWIRTLRIRAYLLADRIQEAKLAADESREAGRGRVNGLLIYTAGLADLAADDRVGALIMTRRLTHAGQKVWRYLLSAEMALARGDAGSAQSALSLASQGINLQTIICPGISVEPYMLHAQARTLLALDRPRAAERLLSRLTHLGSRGLFAPDILVPARETLARVRERLDDPAGAAEVYGEILDLWGEGEETPVLQRAKQALGRLRGD
jgi:hypothetical protein